MRVAVRRSSFSSSPISGETWAICALDGGHLFGQYGVDLVEIGFDGGQPIARRRPLGGNSQIEIDVRVHARQQLLHH